MVILRNYQTDIIKQTHASMKAKHKHPLVCLPTGSGKTVVFAWLASKTQQNNKIVWFVVHRKELLEQTIDTFNKFEIPIDNIHVGMVHSFAHHPERYPAPDLIIYDECHHCVANTWKKLIDQHPDAYMIGLTATPCRLDGKPLGAIYDDLIVGVSTKELTDQGYLAPYKYYAPSVANLTGIKMRGKEYNLTEATELLNQRAVFGDVIKHWHKYANNLQTICYCSSVVHSMATAEAFRADGINAVHFDGNTKKHEREQIVADFRNGKITVLCNVDLIGEGFDVPDCWCCVFLRPTTSTGLFIQQAGRSLRPQPGKTAIILDHVANYTRHGLPDDPHEWSLSETLKSSSRFKNDGTLKVKQCLYCYATFAAGPTECPNCGMPVAKTREEIKQIEAVRLEEIKRSEAIRMDRARLKVQERVGGRDIEDCRSLFEVQQWCKMNGKSSGYGYMYAKRKRLIR